MNILLLKKQKIFKSLIIFAGYGIFHELSNPFLSSACSMCFSDSLDNPLNKGLKAAMLVLFAVLVMVLSLFIGFFLKLRQRIKITKNL